MEKLKKIGIGLLIVLVILSLIFDITYFVIRFLAPQKSVVYTLEGGTLKNVEDINKKYIFNIRYFKNLDNSGKEMFELKLNSFIDENSNEVYSRGIQLLEPEVYEFENKEYPDLISVNYNRDTAFAPFYIYNMFDEGCYVVDSYVPEEFNEIEMINKSRFIFNKNFYLISIGEDIFKMSFKEDFEKIGTKWDFLFANPINLHYNPAYFIANMYESMKDARIGENQTILFDLFDYFVFSKYDKNEGAYTEILNKNTEDYTLVTNYLSTYFAVKIDVYEYGITSSTESLFNCVFGSYSYNTNEVETTNYFVGQNVINLNEFSFNYKVDEDNKTYYIVLKDSIKTYLSKFKNFVLDIKINMNTLKNNGIDSFEVYKDELNLGELEVLSFVKNTYNSQEESVLSEVIYV